MEKEQERRRKYLEEQERLIREKQQQQKQQGQQLRQAQTPQKHSQQHTDTPKSKLFLKNFVLVISVYFNFC